ncbi:uncharacterized protein LOC108674971 [Hyalella azteca]|uniref:Uncharacterized protein LOC108674971 n=1 Tax=Hyalella azteca TaxID=294128 RepID=A0A8B7P033_HYAAZ|nr:uncharacterized protein LOC108674971 [Hyalella azteca]
MSSSTFECLVVLQPLLDSAEEKDCIAEPSSSQGCLVAGRASSEVMNAGATPSIIEIASDNIKEELVDDIKVILVKEEPLSDETVVSSSSELSSAGGTTAAAGGGDHFSASSSSSQVTKRSQQGGKIHSLSPIEELRFVIQKHLCLSEDVLEAVMRAIQEAGAENLDDAREFVVEKDLAGILKPVQIRKLLKRWSEPDTVELVQVEPAVPITLHCPASNCDPSWPLTLDLKLDSLEADLKNNIYSQHRVVGRQRRTLVRHILAQVHKVTKKPCKKQLRIIASRIHYMYPKAITDHIDGNIIGTGFETFLNQLINRNDNYQRKTPCLLPKPTGNHEVVSPTITEQQECGSVSERAASLKRSFVDGANLSEFMSATFKLQRADINSKTVSDVMAEWPMLKTSAVILCHFEELTKVPLEQSFKEKIPQFSERLVDFTTSDSSKHRARSTAIYIEMLEATYATGCHGGSYLGVLSLIMLHLNEAVDALFPLVHEQTLPHELPLAEATRPMLFVFGPSLVQARKTVLAFNQQVVCEVSSPLEGLATLFAAYYVFKYEYPPSACATLELLQRYCAGLDFVPRQMRRRSRVHPRVVKLISDISDHQWRTRIEERRSVFNQELSAA